MRCSIRWIRQLGFSVAVLCLLLSVVEIGVRVYETRENQLVLQETGVSQLTTPATTTYVELAPASTVVVRSGDDDRPITFRTNSYGIRGPEPVVPKPAGLFRVLVLGDERVLGAELPESATFCQRLQVSLEQSASTPVEVLNAGVPGFCPLLSYLQLKLRLLSLEPNLVILHFDMSDVSDDHRVRRFVKLNDAGLPICATHPDALLACGRSQPRLIDQFRVSRLSLDFFVSRWSRHVAETDVPDMDSPPGNCRWAMDAPPDWAPYIQQALEPIVLIRDLTEESYARFLLTASPLPWQISATASNTPEARGPAGQLMGTRISSHHAFEILTDFAEARQITFLDALPRFAAVDDPDTHWLQTSRGLSGRGHDEYARLLAEYLQQQMASEWNLPLARIPTESRMAESIR